MSTNPLIRTIEIGLFLGIVLHWLVGIKLWAENRKIRSRKYSVSPGSSTSSLASRISFVSGSIVFIFLVVHLRTFFVPARFGDEELSMYLLVKEAFASPGYSAFYIIALVLLGYHLRHGFQSAFQTFGIRGSRYQFLIEACSFVFWFLVPLGFATMPLYFLFGIS